MEMQLLLACVCNAVKLVENYKYFFNNSLIKQGNASSIVFE